MARWRRFRGIFGPEPRRDVDDELSFHLEMRIREFVERGESPARARELAVQRFGDYQSSRIECVEISKRRARSMARTAYMAELRQDAGYALRILRRTPGFAIVAVGTLALGIGATSAIFSVVHGVLLQPLPFRNAERLYRVRMLYPDGTAYAALSAPDFMSVREDNRVFEEVEAYSTGIFTLLGAGEPTEVRGATVSDGLFAMLGLPTVHGRGFLPEEHQPERGNVAVLDHGFWQRMFGGDRGVLGRPVSVGGDLYTIVGVLAPGAGLPADADMYAPLEYGATFSSTTATARRSEYLAVVGRARPGVDAGTIDDDLRRIGTRLQAEFPGSNARLTINAIALHQMIVGDVRTPLMVLMGAVGFVLLVACANVANLLLARASARQGELAVRAALGAGRLRLLRQLSTEAIVLGLAGGAGGLAIAYWGTRALVAAQPADIPRLDEVGVSGAVVLFTLGTASATSLIFGVLPALQATAGRLTRALREGGRAGAGSAGQRMRAALVVAEMALAVVLLTGAGLLIRSFVELTRVQPGFRAEQAMAFRLTLQGDEYQRAPQLRNRVAQFEERVRALPGVIAVAGTTVLPLNGLGSILNFAVEGAPPPPPDVNQEIAIASITPGYFRAIGTPIRHGRPFTDRDHSEAPPVAIVNEAAVRRWFPDQDPIGRRVIVGNSTREIVAVVADVLQRDPGQQAAPQLFAPYTQATTRSIRIVVRTAGDPLALASSIRAEIRALDPNLAIAEFTPLEQLVIRSVARPRFYTALLGLFAGVALALAATGIFGVMSYAVAQRTREISIRMALGARAGTVLRTIVGRALALAAVGAVLGIAAAAALGRVIQKQLFGVALLDPWTIGAVVLVLGLSAAAASFLPARRAARLDPAAALRES
jgi:putative ABC transport system permease protein